MPRSDLDLSARLGQSDAINEGFARPDGDIIAWSNLDAGVIPRVVDHFDQHDADMIYGDLAYIDRDATVITVCI